MPFPPHFDGRRFYNPGAPQAAGPAQVFEWAIARRPEKSPDFVPVRQSIPPGAVEPGSLVITLVNHSTVLLQWPGCNILADPIWSKRCSPIPFLGPRRHRAPGIDFANLPPVQVVLLSHNHYDHLDLPTLRRLAQRGTAAFVVPVGVAPYLESRSIQPAQQLDWGERLAIGGAVVHAVPAFHFSGRGLFDRNKSLWCGYIVESPIGNVYLAADTGFGPHFGWIRDIFGPPAVALLPIGAYEPRWFMSPIHMGPDEALKAHQILGAKVSIPIHYGTFQLADESIDTPRTRLQSLAGSGVFRFLDNGQSERFTASK